MTRTTARGLEGRGARLQLEQLGALGRRVGAVRGADLPVACDFVALAADCVVEVAFYEGHCCDRGAGEGLDYLEWGHEAVLFDFAERGVDFGAGLGEGFRRGGEVGEGCGVELRFEGPVFVKGFYGTRGVVGRRVGAEDVGVEGCAFAE